MTDEKKQFFMSYWRERCYREPTTAVRSAIATGLVNFLSYHDCFDLITERGPIDERLRTRLLAQLFQTVKDAPSAESNRMVLDLLVRLEITPYPQKNTIAYLLELLYSAVSRHQRQRILEVFLDSEKRGMRRRAYKLMRDNWSSSFKPKLERSWKQWHESESALMIVDRFDPSFLVAHIDQLTRDLDDGALVSRLYLRASVADSGILKKLKRVDGITYAYVIARRGEKISVTMARQLMKRYEYDSRLPILAWSFARFGHWDLLVELANNVDVIEEQQRRRRFQDYGMDSESYKATFLQSVN